MDKINQHKIEERDEATQEDHRDDNDNSRVTQLLVTAEPFFLWVPRPGSLLQLDLHFTEEVFDFGDHLTFKKTSNIQRPTSNAQLGLFEFEVQRSTLGVRRLQPLVHARRDSNPQPTVLETATLPIELLAYL
jgi:hypothetical protein